MLHVVDCRPSSSSSAWAETSGAPPPRLQAVDHRRSISPDRRVIIARRRARRLDALDSVGYSHGNERDNRAVSAPLFPPPSLIATSRLIMCDRMRSLCRVELARGDEMRMHFNVFGNDPLDSGSGVREDRKGEKCTSICSEKSSSHGGGDKSKLFHLVRD